MVVPVLVSAGTYTCEVVVVAGIVLAEAEMLAEARPTEGARVIGFEVVARLTKLVIT